MLDLKSCLQSHSSTFKSFATEASKVVESFKRRTLLKIWRLVIKADSRQNTYPSSLSTRSLLMGDFCFQDNRGQPQTYFFHLIRRGITEKY